MSAAIDAAQVRHIAKLARLNLTADEIALFAGQLGKILEYVKQLDAVDTTGVEPLAHALPVRDVVRDDVPGATLSAETALRNAPQRAESFFKVPAVLDGGGA
jgi:aspartyl-tRNA(Asn)/glutamyl-tRNA(Gln) amidotransferase subunit C